MTPKHDNDTAATAAATTTAYVLYVDHQGHPAPLTECFYATASRRLSSTVDRQHRPSTITQVDSAYCPQCLSFHDSSSGSQLGFCPQPTCLQCPLCLSIVSCQRIVLLDGGEAFFGYTCGKCDWNSARCCDLKIPTSSTESTTTKEDLTVALTKLTDMLKERRQVGEHKKATEDHYRKILSAWERIVKPSARSTRGTNTNSNQKEEEAWSVEALETAMNKKKEMLLGQTSLAGIELQRISLDEEQTLDSTLQGQSMMSLALHAMDNGRPTQSMADLLPLPVPLRVRKSRRCRAELAEGKPGILIKPKLNPLEGDSSLRTGHGQWWKKDSSAVHVVPKLKIIKHGSASHQNTQQHAFLVKVTNPTLGLVRLRFCSSIYSGEPLWDDKDKRNPFMENLLVETLTDKRVDLLLLNSARNDTKSELIELDSAEESFVDMGKVREIPEEVVKWQPSDAMAAAGTPLDGLEHNQISISSVKKVANKAGSAWVEVVCCSKLITETEHSLLFAGLPISIQIEVGNGSWDSSLVQTTTGYDNNEADFVALDLVIAWQESSN